MPRLSQTEMLNIIRLTRLGYSQAHIAHLYNTSAMTITRLINRFNATGDAAYRHGVGRPRITNRREDNIIGLTVNRRRTLNSRQIRNATGINVSCQTLRRRLHERNLRARSRAACPLLLPEHRTARRNWTRTHRNWGVVEWSRCLFVDESRFNMHMSDGRILVWRERGERFREEHMERRVAFGGGGVTVWGGINRNGRTDLVVLIGESMNAERYCDRCARDVVVPYARNFGDDFILVDDNARPHRARIVTNLLREQNIERMEWPARSPNMNPIEHVWSNLKLRLNQEGNEFDNMNDLANAIVREWEATPQILIRNLVDSMPSRVQDVIRNRGGPTRY